MELNIFSNFNGGIRKTLNQSVFVINCDRKDTD